MKMQEIHIRDPFILYEDGKYYLYGTRAASHGIRSGGFDVYVSEDMMEWSEPMACFDSETYGLNARANWAPEVHKYRGAYYMLATFTQENGLRGVYALRADSPFGPFVPLSKGALTPHEWECLDGTLYVDEDGVPYLVFCHEHTQIIDGTMCYVKLSKTLDSADGDVVTMFSASSYPLVDPVKNGHYVTDGPFMYRTKTGELFMIWSSFIKEKYAEFVLKFKNGKFGLEFEPMAPLLDNDGGHGMIFTDEKNTYFVYHTPNHNPLERPALRLLEDGGDFIRLKNNEVIT